MPDYASLAEEIAATGLRDALNAATGLGIEFERREGGGFADFNGDLRGTDVPTGRKAVVIVQGGESDNRHLLRLLHNAADKGASVLVWVVGSVNRMHPPTMEWLAANLNDGIAVKFLVFSREAGFTPVTAKNWRRLNRGRTTGGEVAGNARPE